MRFHTRKWVKPKDLNPNGTLFGGKFGITSLTLKCEARNMMTRESIISIDNIFETKDKRN